MFVIKMLRLVINIFKQSRLPYLRRMFPKSSFFKALAWGFAVTVLVSFLLQRVGFIKIDFDEYLENILILGSWWMLCSLVFYYSRKIRLRKQSLLRILYLALFLTGTLLLDQWMSIPDNPVSIFLLILFWMGIAQFVAPAFFKKFQKVIFLVYGLIWVGFSLLRWNETYLREHHELAIFMLLIPIPFFLLLWVFEQWKRMRDLENQKNQAELAMLKNQINPHFLFNTLNNLYGLSVEKSDAAPEVVLKLSDMMRYTIYEGKENEVLLSKEVEYLESFLALHKLRHRNAPDIKFKVDVIDGLKIAPLLFIVPVENAFKHGVEKLTEGAFVTIDLYVNLDKLSLKVVNNYDLEGKDEENGIGLENLKRRLELTYPGGHSLQITQKNGIYTLVLEILWSR
ncbi:signaling protein without kinase domain protein [Algoriphagus machipongonensis]|uniref:Signaling protein without kinase domain protein n=2 Tax=Algoriphagus machipongonensis TaxID=388413 RepID=A3HWC8_9BACT|nr:signaling protein without kinase domain protein [Algoriphagus machipongonensis]